MVLSYAMRLFVIAAALTAGAVLAAAGACSSPGSETPQAAESGADAAEGVDAAEAAPGLPYPLGQACAPTNHPDATVCRACLYRHCCDSRARLFATAAGAALVSCTQPTAADGGALPCDTDCLAGCLAAAPPTDSTHYLENVACAVHQCPTECGPHPDQKDACVLCTEVECTQDSLACSLSRDCFLFQACRVECDDDAICINRCAAGYPAGEKLSSRVVLCGINRCAKDCVPK